MAMGEDADMLEQIEASIGRVAQCYRGIAASLEMKKKEDDSRKKREEEEEESVVSAQESNQVLEGTLPAL